MTKKICAVILAFLISLAFTTIVVGDDGDRDLPMRTRIMEVPVDEIIGDGELFE